MHGLLIRHDLTNNTYYLLIMCGLFNYPLYMHLILCLNVGSQSCFHMASVMLVRVRSTSVVPRPIPSSSACNIEMLGGPGDKVKLSVLIKVFFI